jgi:hypothetical protein
LSVGLPRELLRWLAAALLLAVLAFHFAGRRIGRAPAGGVALGLWSFIVSTAHGAGLMLVPALAPLCPSGVPGRELTASGPLLLALATVPVHTGAMPAAMACMSAGVQCMIDFFKRLREDAPAAT